jgi:DUF2946 family protein
MVRPVHEALPPIWRSVGAALGAFALGVQLVLSAWFIVQSAVAADPALQVICSHDGSAPAAAGDDGAPATPTSHSQCPACACVQSAKILAPPPDAPRFVVLRPRSQALPPAAVRVIARLHLRSPYASRAPPLSA